MIWIQRIKTEQVDANLMIITSTNEAWQEKLFEEKRQDILDGTEETEFFVS